MAVARAAIKVQSRPAKTVISGVARCNGVAMTQEREREEMRGIPGISGQKLKNGNAGRGLTRTSLRRELRTSSTVLLLVFFWFFPPSKKNMKKKAFAAERGSRTVRPSRSICAAKYYPHDATHEWRTNDIHILIDS